MTQLHHDRSAPTLLEACPSDKRGNGNTDLQLRQVPAVPEAGKASPGSCHFGARAVGPAEEIARVPEKLICR